MLISSSRELDAFIPKMVLNVAINYSSKVEILNAVKILLKNNRKLNIKNVERYLLTSSSGHPEIIIRTGGYKRLSDFLLWQAAYSELFFENKLWPDFKVNDLKKILKKFFQIKRNFGK